MFPASIVILQILCTIIFGAEIQNENKNTKSIQNKNAGHPNISGISVLGSIYRNTRQARCYRCYEEGYSRYYDDGRGHYNPSSRSYSSNYGDDRNSNWYTGSYERYDDRARYYDDRYSDRHQQRNDYYNSDRYRYNDRTYDKYERYNSNRYDRDRYYPSRTYDRYDRPREYDDRNNGYGRDRYYDRYDNRYLERDDRYPPSSFGGYDGGYRVSYRPYDDYRGQSAIDTSSGRGYWFADRTYNDRRDSSSPLPHGGSHYLPNNDQPPPHPLQEGSNVNITSGQPSRDYEYKRPQSHSNQQSPNSNDGYAGGWSYSNDRDKSNNNIGYNQIDRDKDIMSSPYGSRGRPLSGSYLHDRESNDPSKAESQPNESSSKKPEGQTNNDNSSRIDNKNGRNNSENKSKTL
ncbi:probable serine/threonine-protein kinase clkA isoform X2 [Condylostylus longicornis]|uniref:probable serine/threonine-protein kinase clkA isoform X2 n=1 Tax=Condylostylus longicornis TaxID=2530218 RepID=UPI00244DA428|nr:probable serine/threonine-protein kinase clkA isoform X2 [Condylostylus longicornis]